MSSIFIVPFSRLPFSHYAKLLEASPPHGSKIGIELSWKKSASSNEAARKGGERQKRKRCYRLFGYETELRQEVPGSNLASAVNSSGGHR